MMDKFKCDILTILLIFIAEIHSYAPIPKSKPRILNIGPKKDFTAGSNVTLECEGDYPLKWELPETDENYIFSTNEKNEIFNGIRRLYKNTLNMITVEYKQTGLYTCCYNTTSGNCQHENYSSSVYLFINDEENPLLDPNEPTIVFHGKITILPCRPTISTLDVTLWNAQEEYISLSEDVLFDATQGFIIKTPDESYEGTFYCKTEYNGKNHEVPLILEHHMPVQLYPKISSNNTKYFIEGSKLFLNCSVNTSKGTGVIVMTWDYPNMNDNRTINKESYSIINGTSRFGIKELVINSVQLNDSGLYTCIVTDHFGNNFTVNKTIEVYDHVNYKNRLHINLTMDAKLIERRKKEMVLFKVHIETSPYVKRVTCEWEKDGNLIKIDSRLKRTCTNSLATLKVTSLDLEDSGNYTLFVMYESMKTNITMTLHVFDKPIIQIIGNKTFYMVNIIYSLNCKATGFPESSVKWMWKPSDNTDIAEWIDAMENQTNIISITEFDDSSKLIVTGNQSGYYRCVGTNFVGTNEETIPFIVTDAKNGFEIYQTSKIPIEQDEIEIFCKTSDHIYKDIVWSWRKRMEEENILIIANNSLDINVINKNTVYSNAQILKFASVQLEHSGNYTCISTKWDNTSESKTIQLKVRAIEKPSFTMTNMNGEKLSVSSRDHFEFNCFVHGVPTPTIIWYRNDEKLNVSYVNGIELMKDSQKLVIDRVDIKDAGFYECRVKNRGGSIVGSVTFDVIEEALMVEEKFTDKEISLIVIFVILALALAILLMLFIKRIHKERKRKREFKIITKNMFYKGQMEMFNPEIPLDEQIDLLPYDNNCEFPRERLKLGKTLGQGAFGRVVKAEAIGIKKDEDSTIVAVKMLKERADISQQKALMAELKILMYLGHHINIVNFLGAVTENMINGGLMVIVEYCRYGNLRHYLLRKKNNFISQLDPETDSVDNSICFLPGSPGSENIEKIAINYENLLYSGINSPKPMKYFPRYCELPQRKISFNSEGDSTGNKTSLTKTTGISEDSNQSEVIMSGSESKDNADIENETLTTCDLLYFAFQCACGMEYLSSKKLIHRDLAARNVLLAENNIVKICDFGLAKDCYKYSNYVKKTNGPLPIKWLAIESIRDKVFTIKTDVWSFGVLIWEIFSLGATPYPGIDIDAEFYKMLTNGYRMEKPKYAPGNAYEIMKRCWNSEPENRPGFSELVEQLGTLIEDNVLKYHNELNKSYEFMNDELARNSVYLQMGNNATVNYVNMRNSLTESTNSFHYDSVGAIRPVDDGPVPTTPMEVVPMIQLEPINNTLPEINNYQNIQPSLQTKSNLSTNEDILESCKSDYLFMSSPKSIEENVHLNNGFIFGQ